MNQYTLLTAALLALAPFARAETLHGTGRAAYSVRATGHTVEGEVELQPFNAELADGVLSMSIDARILEMSSRNEKRDEEMRHVLHAENHPLVQGIAEGIPVADLKADEGGGAVMPITFTLAGVSVKKDARVTSFNETEGGMEMTLAFEVSQLEHSLEPIRKFLLLTVDDTVHVEVDLALAR